MCLARYDAHVAFPGMLKPDEILAVPPVFKTLRDMVYLAHI